MPVIPKSFLRLVKDQTHSSNIGKAYARWLHDWFGAYRNVVINILSNKKIVEFDEYKPQPMTTGQEVQLDATLDLINSPTARFAIRRFIVTAYERGTKQAERLLKTVKVVPAQSYTQQTVIDNLVNVNISQIKNVTAKMLSKVRLLVAETISSQKSMNKLIKEIMKVTKFTYARARNIAYNEVRRAINNAKAISYKSSGVGAWMWQASIGTNVCNFCLGLHGKVVKIGKTFGVSPHTKRDVYKPPDAHPQCKCSVAPIPLGYVVPVIVQPIPQVATV